MASAIPFIMDAMRMNKDSMPQRTRTHFQTLEDMLVRQVGNREVWISQAIGGSPQAPA